MYNKITMAKSAIRIQARNLRASGLGIKVIAGKLGVSSSTVSLWCRDIKLTQKQIEELERRYHDPHYGRRLGYSLMQQEQRIQKTQQLFTKGIKDVGSLTKRELFISGISLYWAEGFKKDNLVGFSNSDPKMIKHFIKWLNLCCDISIDRIKLRLGLNQQYLDRTREIEEFWSKELTIPLKQFQKPFYQKVVWQKKYDHPENYHGVLRVRVTKSTDLLRIIHGWIEGLNIT
jgi:hypothetical protein